MNVTFTSQHHKCNIYRWGATPLQDSVSAGQKQSANLIMAADGGLSNSFGYANIFQAASNGDVKTLRMLLEYAGLKVQSQKALQSTL